MSLPLKDLGSVKVSERSHAYLHARADVKRLDVVALVRDLIEQYVEDELHISSLANDRITVQEASEIRRDRRKDEQKQAGLARPYRDISGGHS